MNSEQMKVRKFYKEFFSWSADNLGPWIAAGFMEVFYFAMMAIPYEEILEEGAFVLFPLMLGFFGAYFYLNPYIVFREDTKTYSIYERIKFLPVDFREIQKMRTIYLAKFVAKIAPMIILIQLLTTHFSYGITVESVVYAVFGGLIWPFLSNLPVAWFSK